MASSYDVASIETALLAPHLLRRPTSVVGIWIAYCGRTVTLDLANVIGRSYTMLNISCQECNDAWDTEAEVIRVRRNG